MGDVFVPLRSNAKSLVVGPGVAALRKRLKTASILFDSVLLEGGGLMISAGPGGTITLSGGDEERFQRLAARRTGPGHRFHLQLAASSGGPMQKVIDSEAVLTWEPTLMPFKRELPPECDWFRWVKAPEPHGLKELAERWCRLDADNAVLAREISDPFSRGLIVRNANLDMAVAALTNTSVMPDPLHGKVLEARFRDASWSAGGFALPIVLPAVVNLDWSDVAEIRRHKALRRFRAVLREVEAQALDDVSSEGDLEAATHRAYGRYLAGAGGDLPSALGVAGRTLGGFVIGGMLGMATAGWTGLGGVAAGAAVGSGPGMVADLRNFRRARIARGWLALHQRLS